jgi:HEXXH motif-containing protein
LLRPAPQLASAINVDIRDRLNVALDHLIVDVIGEARGAEERSFGPAAHALQAAMRDAATRNDVGAIRALLAAHRPVLSLPEPLEPCRVVAWGANGPEASETVLLQAAFSDDIGLTAKLVTPGAQVVERTSRMVAALRSDLAAATPAWCVELETLVSTILLATTEESSQRFGGASAFAAWGAILVNPTANDTPRKLALTLIHESSHLKLFHAYLDDEVVLNDPNATYTSPLRRETRPMNGIFHAAFVLARMILFSTDLLQSGQTDAVLGHGETARLRDDLRRSIGLFDEAHGVIEAHGELTPKGSAILAEAAALVATVRRQSP